MEGAVIARKLGAMPEIIDESGAGLGYSSEGELRDAMSRLLDHPGLRHVATRDHPLAQPSDAAV